jgi:predicted dehydrogenase
MPNKNVKDTTRKWSDWLSRREFLKTSAVVSATALVAGCATGRRAAPGILHPEYKPEKLRVGLIGCGGRGTGAAFDCVNSSPNIEIVAMGDLFQNRLDQSRNQLKELGEACKVTDDHCFVGFDAYQGVLASDIDVVIMAPPPHFRPLHLKAAVEAGKHVFMEKPVAVDPVGVRSIIASSKLAAQKGLAVVAGTQRRHQPSYLETMKRVHGGAIGEVVAAQCYWNQGGLWEQRAAHNWEKYQSGEWSDMEWQIRNWLFLIWLSGDHIVEQHVHNIDVVNWALQSPPVKAVGMGGRQARTDPKYGNIYDHFSVEYEYPNGVRVLSMCRQIAGSSSRVSERIVGTKGVANPDGEIQGRRRFKYEPPEGSEQNPYVLEHRDLIASIRRGKPLNEGKRIAESTLTAIMGRMSAYTGREFQWNWLMNQSQLDLTPPAYEFGDLPVAPVPIPGETKLV